MNNPLSYLHDQLEQWRAEGTYQRLRVLESESAAESRFDGKEVIKLTASRKSGPPTLSRSAIAPSPHTPMRGPPHSQRAATPPGRPPAATASVRALCARSPGP